MGAQNFSKPAKVKVVKTLPNLGNAEIGELYYDVTNAKIALRTITGWVYFSKDI